MFRFGSLIMDRGLPRPPISPQVDGLVPDYRVAAATPCLFACSLASTFVLLLGFVVRFKIVFMHENEFGLVCEPPKGLRVPFDGSNAAEEAPQLQLWQHLRFPSHLCMS